MPNCFQLTRKGETTPTVLTKVDEHICQFLNVPCNDVAWVEGWYDVIGFRLAIGQSWDDMRQYFIHECRSHDFSIKMLRIINFLDDHYTSDCWVEIGRARS